MSCQLAQLGSHLPILSELDSFRIGYNLIKLSARDVAAITIARNWAAPKMCFLLESPVARFANHPFANIAVSDPDLDPDPEPSVVSGESFEAF